MKIFPSVLIPEIDQYTVQHTPISEIDLMEHASTQCTQYILKNFSKKRPFVVLVGPGNNGGDGLAITRQLHLSGANVEVYLLVSETQLSQLSRINLDRLRSCTESVIHEFDDDEKRILFSSSQVIIDTIFGCGLSRPAEGYFKSVIKSMNAATATVVSIDMPSGLFSEFNPNLDESAIVRADITLTFQFPKISLLFQENEKFVGKYEVLDISLHKDALVTKPTDWELFDIDYAASKLKERDVFAHKGNFGHALLVAGGYGKIGAAILASKATLRSGAGLLTTHVPRQGYEIMQNSFPEAMVSHDQSDIMFSQAPDLSSYTAVGIGPGLGTTTNTKRGLLDLIKRCRKPLVMDADALNILSEHPEYIDLLPHGTILTPHLGEFKRLVGDFASGFERMQAAIDLAGRFEGIIVVKGAKTMVVSSNGKVFFNTTGNSGMATAGSGDVLTGVILGLLASGYNSFDAARLGVYLHGLAGDIGIQDSSMEALVASDIISSLGKAFSNVHAYKQSIM